MCVRVSEPTTGSAARLRRVADSGTGKVSRLAKAGSEGNEARTEAQMRVQPVSSDSLVVPGTHTQTHFSVRP